MNYLYASTLCWVLTESFGFRRCYAYLLTTLGYFEVFGSANNPDNTEAGQADLQQGLPTLVYYSRKNAGTPKISPKAGNM